MLETSARLLALLSLLQARREWRGPELAERLEVGLRTVRRDVDRLRRLGYPVEATPGAAGGYRLGPGASVPPLLLDEEEAVAVAVGLRTAASVGVAGIEETSVRALAKLERVMPPRVRRLRFRYVSRSISASRDRWQARVVLRAPLEQVASRVPPAVGTLEAIDERSCLLRTGADWLGGLAVYVADIGVDFEVIDPPEFAEQVRVLAARFARAVG
jgi:predicted DNA-binding transcriptional regulator YafY